MLLSIEEPKCQVQIPVGARISIPGRPLFRVNAFSSFIVLRLPEKQICKLIVDRSHIL